MAGPALLFDLDGTLIDSDPLHFRVFADLFGARGREIDMAFYADEVHGRHNTDIFRAHFPDEDPFEMHLAKEAAFRDILGASVPPMAGVGSVISRAAAGGWPMAVVTNAPRLNADAMLRATGLIDRFDAVIIGEECDRGKPDPAPYRAALAALGVAHVDAIAFEDSRSGLRSATGAGIRTIGIRSSLGDADLRAAGAALSIEDFNDTALGPELERLEGAMP